MAEGEKELSVLGCYCPSLKQKSLGKQTTIVC
jgi:hypothetical protein